MASLGGSQLGSASLDSRKATVFASILNMLCEQHSMQAQTGDCRLCSRPEKQLLVPRLQCSSAPHHREENGVPVDT